MEQEKNKRAREYVDDGEAEIWCSFENNKKAKKRDVCGISFTTKDKKEVEEKGCFKAWEWDSKLAFGVFDFPWLKDGVISKSEDCFMDFEDNFLSSLKGQQDTSFKVSGIDFFEEYEYGLCEAPEASMAHIPEAKLMEDVWLPFEINELELESEELDCIWSSLLNKPASLTETTT